MANTDRAWETWGEHDPYFAVVSLPQFRRERLDDNRPAFFESGFDYIAGRLATVERLYGPQSRQAALDFGCGVGRLLIPLARRFEAVTGVDVADAMLRECRTNLEAAGIANVTLAKSDDRLSGLSGQFDFVHSYLVLQHIPVARGMALIDRLLALTSEDGVASIHLTLDRGDSPWQAGLYWARRHLPGFQGAVNLARGRRFAEPLIQMNQYGLSAVLRLILGNGFGPVTVELEYHGRILSAHLIARKQRLGGQPSRD